MVRMCKSKYRHAFVLKYIFTNAPKTYRHFSDLDLIYHRVEHEDFSKVSVIMLFKRVKYQHNDLLIKTEKKAEFLEKLKELMGVES